MIVAPLVRRLLLALVMRSDAGVLTSYGDFAAHLYAQGILGDPWVDGAPRFRMTPIEIDRATERALYAAAEGVAAVHAEAASLCARFPALVSRYFDLPPSFQLMWEVSRGAWHGIARADVFMTADGPKVCELNSDTPSGAPEAVALNRAVDGSGAALFDDPNSNLADCVCDLAEAFARDLLTTECALVRAGAEPARRPSAVGIVLQPPDPSAPSRFYFGGSPASHGQFWSWYGAPRCGAGAGTSACPAPARLRPRTDFRPVTRPTFWSGSPGRSTAIGPGWRSLPSGRQHGGGSGFGSHHPGRHGSLGRVHVGGGHFG